MFIIVLCVAFFDVSHANVCIRWLMRVYVCTDVYVRVRVRVFVFEMTHMHFLY